ncbi:MAG: hypothetical protein ACYC27_06040 [Armatimonadota bacterium]
MGRTIANRCFGRKGEAVAAEAGPVYTDPLILTFSRKRAKGLLYLYSRISLDMCGMG